MDQKKKKKYCFLLASLLLPGDFFARKLNKKSCFQKWKKKEIEQ